MKSACFLRERLALTYSQMVTSQPILQEVAMKVGLDSSEGLANKIKAEPITDTQLIRLTVTDSSPEQAALIANTTADVLSLYILQLQTERYAASLDSVQAQIDYLSTQVGDTQAQLDTAIARKMEADLELAHQQNPRMGTWRIAARCS